MSPKSKPKTHRPWWRHPLKVLLRARLRRRHVHGTFMHRMLGERLLAPALWVPNMEPAARGLAFGTFAGLLPLPAQSFFAVLLCYALRGNVAAAVLATFFSNPLTTPAIIWTQFKIGQWVLPAMRFLGTDDYHSTGRYFETYGKPFLVGSLVSAVIAGLLAYPIMIGIWKLGAAAVERRRRRVAELRAAAEARATAKENAED